MTSAQFLSYLFPSLHQCGGLWLLGLSMLAFLGVLVTLVFLAAAIGSVQFFITEAERLFKLAREEQDQLFKHFRYHRRS